MSTQLLICMCGFATLLLTGCPKSGGTQGEFWHNRFIYYPVPAGPVVYPKYWPHKSLVAPPGSIKSLVTYPTVSQEELDKHQGTMVDGQTFNTTGKMSVVAFNNEKMSKEEVFDYFKPLLEENGFAEAGSNDNALIYESGGSSGVTVVVLSSPAYEADYCIAVEDWP